MKRTIENYQFDASERRITLSNFSIIRLDRVFMIVNVTRGVIIYSFATPAKIGTVSANILTLVVDTTAMSDSDKLLVIYDDETYEDKLLGYAIAGQDTDGDTIYIGYIKSDGSWYITRSYFSGDKTTKYANGTSGFNWANRTSLTYVDFNTLTW